jgi:putative FmdB family regulatory protein
MPIYEYGCEKCGQLTEIWQKFSDRPISECKLCHGKMKKLISQSTFHLKGTGWYVTDYASKSASCDATSNSGKEQGETSKTDKKAPKVEAKSSTENSAKNDSSSSSKGNK